MGNSTRSGVSVIAGLRGRPAILIKNLLTPTSSSPRYIGVERHYITPQTQADGVLSQEGEVKTSTTIAVALATLLPGPVVANAQTAEPTPYHHYRVHHFQGPHPRHYVHHRFVAHNPAPAPAPAAAVTAPAPAQAAPFGLAWPHIAPYPDNKGDEDGLSEDPNDCNKGCVEGTPNLGPPGCERCRCCPRRHVLEAHLLQKRTRRPIVGS
jgi:hypothetical protein